MKVVDMPGRFWEYGEEKSQTEAEIEEIEEWIKENGIPYDEDLPFN